MVQEQLLGMQKMFSRCDKLLSAVDCSPLYSICKEIKHTLKQWIILRLISLTCTIRLAFRLMKITSNASIRLHFVCGETVPRVFIRLDSITCARMRILYNKSCRVRQLLWEQNSDGLCKYRYQVRFFLEYDLCIFVI